ncbi:MAG TPA: tetratricopeptide repeat protein [Rhodanobacteraceae bacterium]|nr:tetratricopeptide repeat protein [Rhodanobacteraceae bacterium]HEU4857380.1 tetratricopeptide repeat protein [Rhodanobacteraceae bacterium]
MIHATLRNQMQRINGLLQVGDFRAAHDQLDVIARNHPGFAEARRLLAGAKLMLGDAAGAEQVLREAVALDPAWSPTLTMLGELLLGSGRHADAEQYLLQAATAEKADPHAALVLARRYNETRRHARALAVLEPFCAVGKLAPGLAVQHANALVGLDRTEDAIGFYQRRVTEAPDDAGAAEALTFALQAANRHVEAERASRYALQRAPGTAALCRTHAHSLIALGAFDRAEAALRDGLRLDPQHVQAHDDLARLVWMRTGDAAQATALLDDALRRFPHNDALWATRAAVLQGAGDARRAYECLAVRVERPGVAPTLLVRAGLAALEFDPRGALDLAARALAATPADVAARTLRAAALLGVGDARGALSECGVLRAGSPEDQYLIALETTAWRMLDDERYARLCDYPNLVVPYRLEAPLPWKSLAGFLDDVKRSLDALHNAQQYPLLFQSLRHGTETTGDLTRSTDPVIRALFDTFDAPIRDYMQRIGKGGDPLRCRNTGSYRFNGSWSVRLRAQGFHHNHVHPRGWISSACYLQLPDGTQDAHSREGVLTFAQPGILTTPTLAAEHVVRPEVGMLVLFPSYVWHGTVPISGNQLRLTVAFDAVPMS